MRVAGTHVGIVEWARRAHGACATELAAADALGRHVAGTDDVGEQLALVTRARRHAWRAEQWESVVPVLHDVVVDPADGTVEPEVASALARLEDAHDAAGAHSADDALTSSAGAAWRRWSDDAGPVADVPYLRAAERALHDAASEAR